MLRRNHSRPIAEQWPKAFWLTRKAVFWFTCSWLLPSSNSLGALCWQLFERGWKTRLCGEALLCSYMGLRHFLDLTPVLTSFSYIWFVFLQPFSTFLLLWRKYVPYLIVRRTKIVGGKCNTCAKLGRWRSKAKTDSELEYIKMLETSHNKIQQNERECYYYRRNLVSIHTFTYKYHNVLSYDNFHTV